MDFTRLIKLWHDLSNEQVMDRIFDATQWGFADFMMFIFIVLLIANYVIVNIIRFCFYIQDRRS